MKPDRKDRIILKAYSLHLSSSLSVSDSVPKILYCRCAFSQVVPVETKELVLEKLCESERDFECVSDLCEMSARRDERIGELLKGAEKVKIAACYPRAVRWLFHQAGIEFPDDDSVEVLNMRDGDASTVMSGLLDE